MSSPASPLLQRFIDGVLERAPQSMHKILTDSARQVSGGSRAAILATSALSNHHSALLGHWLAALREQVSTAPNSGFGALGASPWLELQLVDESQAEADVEVQRMVEAIEHEAEWELRELQARGATLRGEEAITKQTNPLQPGAVARSLWQATGFLSLGFDARSALMRAVTPVLCRELREAYAQANRELAGWGVAAAAYRAVQGPASGTPPQRWSRAPDSGFIVSHPGAFKPLLAKDSRLARGLISRFGQLGADTTRHAEAALEEALQAMDSTAWDLSSTQSPQLAQADATPPNLLRRHREMLQRAARDDIDRDAIDLLARLFDAMLSDTRLLQSVRAAIGRLQPSVLRIALHDPALLQGDANRTHPTWALLNRISSHAVGYESEEDPRLHEFLMALHQIVDAVAEAKSVDASVHARALRQLEQGIEVLLAEQRALLQPTFAKLQVDEQRGALAVRYHQQMLALLSDLPLGENLHRFLSGPWVQVVTQAAVDHGETSTQVSEALAVVNQLLWSLEPLRRPEDRERLVRLLPTLVGRLERGMKQLGMPEAEQQSLLKELMTLHTEALRNPHQMRATATPTPEDLVRRMREERLPSGALAAPRDSVYDLGNLDTVPFAVLEDEGKANERVRPERMRVGQWHALFLRGEWTPAQLLWQSSTRMHWVFAGRKPNRPLVLTRSAIDRLAREGLIVVLEDRGLVERAVDALIEQQNRVQAG